MVDDGGAKIVARMAAALKSASVSATPTQGLIVGRFGTIEFDVLWLLEHGKDIPADYADILERNAGVFPKTPESIRRWGEEMKKAVQATGCMATGWYTPILVREKELLKRWFSCVSESSVQQTPDYMPLRSIEPYYSGSIRRWTTQCQGQRVCVVSSFVETMKKQIAKGEAVIWPHAGLTLWPPTITWSWVKTGYSPALVEPDEPCSWPEEVKTWEDAVDYMVAEVVKTESRIVIIGCGGLGMILAGRLKALGKICIVMGGAVQVLFGIKGKRWENHDFISAHWNSEWVYPSPSETPKKAVEVERGCYW